MLFIGADHAGFRLKQALKRLLAKKGVRLFDCGTWSNDPVDYPDIAAAVSKHVQKNERNRGLLICGSGIGVAIAANKFSHIRAASIETVPTIQMARHDENVNVLCLGSRILTTQQAAAIIHAFLNTTFSTARRHRLRVEKIISFEQ